MTKKIGLCEGRHSIVHQGVTVEEFVFPTVIDPTNPEALEMDARKSLKGYEGANIELFVTGLSVALIATLNQCKGLNISVTLMHYNRDTGDYYPQEVK